MVPYIPKSLEGFYCNYLQELEEMERYNDLITNYTIKTLKSLKNFYNEDVAEQEVGLFTILGKKTIETLT